MRYRTGLLKCVFIKKLLLSVYYKTGSKCINFFEKANNLFSPNLSVNNCTPMGIPCLSLAMGKEMAGTPVKLASTVKISARYISTGFFVFSPNLKATVGLVGIRIKSYCLNISVSFSVSSLSPFAPGNSRHRNIPSLKQRCRA